MKGKIFNAQEVQALLNGSKVMFREVIKPQPNYQVSVNVQCGNEAIIASVDHPKEVFCLPKCPYKIGQMIFCKEDFFEDLIYRNFVGYGTENNLSDINARTIKINARYMKQEQSRLTLRITNIKVERLQDISREDAIKEGVTSRPNSYGDGYEGYSMDWSRVGKPSKWSPSRTLREVDICLGNPQMAFASFWNSTHKKPEEKWEASPWVWSVNFEVINNLKIK